MKRFGGDWKKGIAWLLIVIMTVGLLPLSAVAEDEETLPAETVTETVEPTETPEPTEEEEPTPEPTPEPAAPKPDYIFLEKTVFLTEILEAVQKSIKANATLSADSEKLILSETEVETENPDRLNLDAITLTAAGHFDYATLTVAEQGRDPFEITVGYPKAQSLTLSYLFTDENDILDLSAFLEENGVRSAVIERYAVAQGSEAAIEIIDQDDTLTAAPMKAFDRIVLRVLTKDGKVYEIALLGWNSTEEPSEAPALVTPAETDGQDEIEKQTLSYSDGESVGVRVSCGARAGIPVGAELQVTEILPDDENYDVYFAAAAETLRLDPDEVDYIRLFDIKLVDRLNPEIVFEPIGAVDGAITLSGDDLNQYDVRVLHFTEGKRTAGLTAEVLENAVSGETVSFETSSFSVYAVVGSVYRRTYVFHTLDEYQDYVEYLLFTDNGENTTRQTIKNGESVVVPANPVNPQDSNATFAGWYEPQTVGGAYQYGSDGKPILQAEPYDFDNIPEITEIEEVKLYAVFRSFVYVVFHGQYDTDTETYPVAFTRRVELVGGTAQFDITGYRVPYDGAENNMVFEAWCDEPVRPGADLTDYGNLAKPTTTNAANEITVTKTKHLYSMFESVYWLSFYSGPTGSGATYYPETYYYNGVGPENLIDRIPTHDSSNSLGAYTFTGWYAKAAADSVILDANNETITSGADVVKIANADGSLVANASAYGVSVSGGKLNLTQNITLYAGWTASGTATYTVVILKQKASDPDDGDSTNNTYEFSESFIIEETIGASVSIGSSSDYAGLNDLTVYNRLHDGTTLSNPYHDYTFNQTNTDARNGSGSTVAGNGSTLLYVCYDWTSQPSAPGAFTLQFVDSVQTAEQTAATLPVVYDQSSGDHAKIPYGTALQDYVPADPVSGIPAGYEFAGWYANEACTTRVFFEDGEAYQSYTGSKALYETMPAADLTVYAGWSLKWYVVTIDPNYGALYAYRNGELKGTGSTWFWSAYGGQIQEYITVTRDFTESATGVWYYVNHAGNGFGGSDYADRYTYYTQDPSEATEFTTFEEDTETYRYAGWYEVYLDENGNEIGEAAEPYDFTRIVDHNTKLRLHWTKTGVFYIEYDAGEGELNREDENEKLYVELDGDSYNDDADVLVTRTAQAPEGYEFVGWTIRGDESGKICRPGKSFKLLSKYTAMVQGKRRLYLDAVYTRTETAQIVYHANAGTLTDPGTDYYTVFGGPAAGAGTTEYALVTDGSDPTVTVSNLPNNGNVLLADGTCFALSGATFAGWCAKEVYDPNDASALLLVPGAQTFAVDTQGSSDLYAVWQIDVNYHLNKDTSEATLGAYWGPNYELNAAGDTYTQTDVYRGDVISYPWMTPSCTDTALTFRYWATKDEHDNYTKYDFTQPVNAVLDLYAVWDAPSTVTVHIVDASSETIELRDEWRTETKLSVRSSEYSSVTVLYLVCSTYAGNVPSGYEYVFAAVVDESTPTDVSGKRAMGIYFDSIEETVKVIYADGTEQALSATESICFVFAAQKRLDISYKLMAADGNLSDVTVDSAAPTSVSLGIEDIYDFANDATAPINHPRAWASNAYTYYSYAIGTTDATNAVNLSLMTSASSSDSDLPSLQIKNTWRGFQYSVDNGQTWVNSEYEPELYVVYYAGDEEPTVVTLHVETQGSAADADRTFTFDYWIEKIYLDSSEGHSAGDSEVTYSTRQYHHSKTLKNGDTYSAFLYTNAHHTYRVTFAQTADPDFDTTIDPSAGTLSHTSGLDHWNTDGYTDDNAHTYAYTAVAGVGDCGGTHHVTFTNSRKPVTIEVHAVKVDVETGNLNLMDTWRSPTASDYSFTLAPGQSEVFRTKLPVNAFAPGADANFGMGAVFGGTDNGSAVIPSGDLTVESISYEPVETGSSEYRIYLKDENGNRVMELGSNQVYYLYYPLLTIYYMLEGENGSLTPIKGSTDGTTLSATITYDGHILLLNNGQTVCQGQKVSMPQNGLVIAQTIGSGVFNLPPVLDNGTNSREIVYSKLGAIPQDDPEEMQDNTSDFVDTSAIPEKGISENMILYMDVVDNQLQWRFDYEDWFTIDKWPVIYAIYRERGYELEITKTVPVDTGDREPFTVTIESEGINRIKYAIEGTGYTEIAATPATPTTPGTITFTVLDGSEVTVFGLAPGPYTVMETNNKNYTLSAALQKESDTDPTDLTVTGNSSVQTFQLEENTKLDLTNTPKYICRIGSQRFYTISDAVQYIVDYSANFTETIYMLEDYEIPVSDAPEIPSYCNITLTSEPGRIRTITRRESYTDGAMFTNLGTFTLSSIIFDGTGVSTSRAMIDNAGNVNISAGAIMQNATGGAINSWSGTVTVNGGTITGCTAPLGGAIYAEGGTVEVSSGLLYNNSAIYGGAIYYAGSDRVTVSGGTVSGNRAQKGGAIYNATGSVTVNGGLVNGNSASVSGGAIYAENAYVNVNGGTISNNTAAVNGGAINIDTLTLAMTAGTITGNTATSGDGGAVWAGIGKVALTGGTISENSALAGNGGGIYCDASVTEIKGASIVTGNTAAVNGGGVYSESGTVTVAKEGTAVPEMTDNIAGFAPDSETGLDTGTGHGSGGGVYAASGTVTVTEATLSGNKANGSSTPNPTTLVTVYDGGAGGALWVGTGTATLTDCTMSSNTAVNGAAVFVNTGKAIFTGTSTASEAPRLVVTGNRASRGGAIGVGGLDARVEFTGKVRIKNNYIGDGSEVSNVYLDQDSDTIIVMYNLVGPWNDANDDLNTFIGIHVPGRMEGQGEDYGDLFLKRGVPGTTFATYTDSDAANKGAFHNGRTNLDVKSDTASKKLLWAKDFRIEVYYTASYASGLPYANGDGTYDYAVSANYARSASGTPPEGNNKIDAIAEDVRSLGIISPDANNDGKGDHDKTAIFGSAFVKTTSGTIASFNEYLTDINWNSEEDHWDYVRKCDVSETTYVHENVEKVIFIYTEPYYINIENNSGSTLTITELSVTVSGTPVSVISDPAAIDANGYGYVFARNDAVQPVLEPVQPSDLVIAPNKTIKLVIPGGKNMAYSLTGSFASASADIPCRQGISALTSSTIALADATTSFTVTGNTPNTSGQTQQIIFGTDRAICRIIPINDAALAGIDPSGYIARAVRQDGTVEYTFSTPNAGAQFVEGHPLAFYNPTDGEFHATIELLEDYLFPGDQQVVLHNTDPYVFHVTFSTACGGVFYYPGNETALVNRATVSRADGNEDSMIKSTAGNNSNVLRLEQLIFDGKSHAGDIDGGIVSTVDWNVEVDHVDFIDCVASNGGGMFIDYTRTEDPGDGKNYLSVSNSNFIGCESQNSTNRYGGGAIWSYARTMTLTNCTFESCTGKDQGGAVFHRIDYKPGNTNNYADCAYRDASTSVITNCSFTNCHSRSGGGVESDAYHVTFEGCTFENCYSVAAADNSTRYGSGGAIATYIYEETGSTSWGDTYSSDLTVRNCQFYQCNAAEGTGTAGNGGAIRSHSLLTTIENSIFNDCLANNNGGAICINNNGTVSDPSNYRAVINGCTITNCTSVAGHGGGIYCEAPILVVDTFTDPDTGEESGLTVFNCTSYKDGGGLCHNKNIAQSTLTMTGASIDRCTANAASSRGGGGIITYAPTVNLTDCTMQNCSTPKDGGGVYVYSGSSDTVTLDHTVIESCSAGDSSTAGNGGGLNTYQGGSGTRALYILNGSEISNNTATGMGGGVYSNARHIYLTESEITANTATGNGGGICQYFNDASASADLNLSGTEARPALISGNISSGVGGGVYTRASLSMQGFVDVISNRLTTETAADVAGVYLADGVNLTIGTTGADETTTVLNIKDNLTESGVNSNLRLPETTSGTIVNANRVVVNCGISGDIGVVNAKNKKTQFGTSNVANPVGFNDLNHVFTEDTDVEPLYGIVDRTNSAGLNIIWGAEPICKITDEKGRLLYLDNAGARPAVFDQLDIGSTVTNDTTSAFGILRKTNPNLFYVDGTAYPNNVYQIKMLVEDYTATKYITTNASVSSRTIYFTTAGSKDSLYPYRGRTGTRSTILRGTSIAATDNLITAKVNMIFQNIILDGNCNDPAFTPGTQSRILMVKDSDNITVKLGKNATFQNAKTKGTGAHDSQSTGNGGGVYIDSNANFIVEGGAIRNCTATRGGGIYKRGTGTLTITAGTITKCTATGETATSASVSADGGGIYLRNGNMNMSGGIISRCEAANGAGIFMNNNRTLYMSGGTITTNHAAEKGGGIVADPTIANNTLGATIYFSGAPYVYGNTCDAASSPGGCSPSYANASNVYMGKSFLTTDNPGTIIITQGLIRGAAIGVYVPDDRARDNLAQTLYEQHGKENTPFGKYDNSIDREVAIANVNYFINDRNGMKGSVEEDTNDKKVYWKPIYTISVTKKVMSDDTYDLNRSYSFTLTLSGSISNIEGSGLRPEMDDASKISDIQLGDMYFVNGVANFILTNGETKTAEMLPFGLDYTITENLTAEEQRHFKTGAENDEGNVQSVTTSGRIKNNKQYIYQVTYTNLDAVCKIVDPTYGLLYIQNRDGNIVPAVYSNLALAFNRINASESNKWFYLNDEEYETVYPGDVSIEMLIEEYEMDYPESLASLVAGKTVTLTTAARNADDGFSYIGGMGTTARIVRRVPNGVRSESMFTVYGDLILEDIVLDGGSLEGYKANDNGCILQVRDGGSVTIDSTVTLRNATVESGKSGACVYLAQGSKLYISGDPQFSNNTVAVSYGSGVTNGTDGSVYSGGTANQDIFIAGYAGADAESLVVAGNLTGAQGSIWVWPEKPLHYRQSTQFALVGTDSSTGNEYTGLDVFRNAWPDGDTGNDATQTPKYLYGVSHSDGNVYWVGSAKFTITKTLLGGSASETFPFTVSGLTGGNDYPYTRYEKENGTWVKKETNAVGYTANADGEITFTLAHNQRIDLTIPLWTVVTVSEENGRFKPSYTLNGVTVEENFVTVTLNADMQIDFVNGNDIISPSGVTFFWTPYILLLTLGFALIPMMAVGGRRKKKKEETL